MRIAIDIAIQCEDWSLTAPALEALAERIADACLETSRILLLEDAELSLLFCDDATIQTLNASWRNQDKPTNVLSFPAASPAELKSARLLGDVAIAFETTKREAMAEGKPFADHVAHLLAHGLLHLFGFDHESDADAERMEAMERAVLARLGVPDPYRIQDLEVR